MTRNEIERANDEELRLLSLHGTTEEVQQMAKEEIERRTVAAIDYEKYEPPMLDLPVDNDGVAVEIPKRLPGRFSLIEIESGVLGIAEEVMAYYDTGEEPPEELLNLMVAGIDAAVEKRDRVAAFFRVAEREVEDIDAEIARLENRKSVIQAGLNRLRSYLLNWMSTTKLLELKGKLSTLKVAKVPDSCAVTDITKLDPRYHSGHKLDLIETVLLQAGTIIEDHINGIERTAWPEVLSAINNALINVRVQKGVPGVDKSALLKAMKASIADKEFQTSIAELDDAGKQQAIRNRIREQFPGAEILNGKTRLMIK